MVKETMGLKRTSPPRILDKAALARDKATVASPMREQRCRGRAESKGHARRKLEGLIDSARTVIDQGRRPDRARVHGSASAPPSPPAYLVAASCTAAQRLIHAVARCGRTPEAGRRLAARAGREVAREYGGRRGVPPPGAFRHLAGARCAGSRPGVPAAVRVGRRHAWVVAMP